jgi:hypothetical protein
MQNSNMTKKYNPPLCGLQDIIFHTKPPSAPSFFYSFLCGLRAFA